jgi:hypothetical protein
MFLDLSGLAPAFENVSVVLHNHLSVFSCPRNESPQNVPSGDCKWHCGRVGQLQSRLCACLPAAPVQVQAAAVHPGLSGVSVVPVHDKHTRQQCGPSVCIGRSWLCEVFGGATAACGGGCSAPLHLLWQCADSSEQEWRTARHSKLATCTSAVSSFLRIIVFLFYLFFYFIYRIEFIGVTARATGDYRRDWRKRYFQVVAGPPPRILYFRDFAVSLQHLFCCAHGCLRGCVAYRKAVPARDNRYPHSAAHTVCRAQMASATLTIALHLPLTGGL